VSTDLATEIFSEALGEALFQLHAAQASINADPQLDLTPALERARHARLAEFDSGVSGATVNLAFALARWATAPDNADQPDRIEAAIILLRDAQAEPPSRQTVKAMRAAVIESLRASDGRADLNEILGLSNTER
jgi:hypothetical protein